MPSVNGAFPGITHVFAQGRKAIWGLCGPGLGPTGHGTLAGIASRAVPQPRRGEGLRRAVDELRAELDHSSAGAPPADPPHELRGSMDGPPTAWDSERGP